MRGADGVAAGVLHVPSIKPVDDAAIAVACANVAVVVTVEERTVIGGRGGLAAEIVTSSRPSASRSGCAGSKDQE